MTGSPVVLTPALVSEQTEVLTPEPGSEVSVGPESGADIRRINNKQFQTLTFKIKKKKIEVEISKVMVVSRR